MKALKGSAIFNPNTKRIQKVVRHDRLIKEIIMFLRDRDFLKYRTVGTTAILHSKAGCKRQQWHTDYDPEKCRESSIKPLGVIFALQDETYFNVHKKKKIVMKKGQILIFDGDLIHAGSAYDVENTRIHIYLDSPDVLRSRNKTYLLN
tara:strand:+ start:130 stop:573 length:444 start_codon:yes stop_codon:yes gene_type:complete